MLSGANTCCCRRLPALTASLLGGSRLGSGGRLGGSRRLRRQQRLRLGCNVLSHTCAACPDVAEGQERKGEEETVAANMRGAALQGPAANARLQTSTAQPPPRYAPARRVDERTPTAPHLDDCQQGGALRRGGHLEAALQTAGGGGGGGMHGRIWGQLRHRLKATLRLAGSAGQGRAGRGGAGQGRAGRGGSDGGGMGKGAVAACADTHARKPRRSVHSAACTARTAARTCTT